MEDALVGYDRAEKSGAAGGGGALALLTAARPPRHVVIINTCGFFEIFCVRISDLDWREISGELT